MRYLYYSGPLSSVASSSPYIILIPRAIFLSQVAIACQSLLSLQSERDEGNWEFMFSLQQFVVNDE